MEDRMSLNEEGGHLGIEKLYNDIVWTHKIHEEQADIYSINGNRLQIASIACIAITAVLSGISIGVDFIWLNISATALALIAAFVAIYREAKPFDVLVCDHSSYAKDYLRLREDLTSILTKKRIDMLSIAFVVDTCSYASMRRVQQTKQ